MKTRIDICFLAKILFKLACFSAFGVSLAFGQTGDRPELATENITIEAKFTSTYYDYMYFSFVGESGTDSWNKSGYTAESTPRVQNIKPGKEYKLSVWGLDSSDVYDISVTVPLGYIAYITDPDGNDLVMRPKVADLIPSGTDVFKIKILPVSEGARGASGLGFGESISMDADRPIWSLGMGTLENGQTAGSIHLRADAITQLVFTPQDLYYSDPSDEVSIVYDGSSRLRQIYAPQGLADILYSSGTTYEIKYYSWLDVEAFNGSVYPIRSGAVEMATYTVSKYSTIGIDVKKTVGSVYWKMRLYKSGSTWTFYDWSKSNSSPSSSNTERKVTTYASTSGSTETRTRTEYGSPLANGSWTVSSKTEYKYYTNTWGQELTEVTLDPDTTSPAASTRRTTYSYHTTGDGEKGQLKRVTRPDGGYTEYEYWNDFDKQGLVYQIKEPFGDDNATKITYFYYGDDTSGDRFLPTSVYVKIDGNEVSRVESAYYSETHNGEPVTKQVAKNFHSPGTGISSYDTTTTYTYREDASDPYLRGAPYAVVRPDNSQTSWAYYDQLLYGYYQGVYGWYYYKVQEAFDGSNLAEATLDAAGFPAASDNYVSGDYMLPIRLIENRSTSRRIHKDISGVVTNEYTHVCESGTSFKLAGGMSYGRDIYGWLLSSSRLTYKNGSLDSTQPLYNAVYTDGQLKQTTDEAGAIKTYGYDDVGRLNKVTDASSSSTTSPYKTPTISSMDTLISYDGSNRVVKREIDDLSSSESIVSEFDYDFAGRLIAKTMDCCETVTYDYDIPGVITTTNDDGGTIVETYYLDGGLESRTGTATTPLYAMRESYNGGMKTQTAKASFATVGTEVEGWSIATVDKMGRQTKAETPTYDGDSKATLYEYNSYGQKTARRLVSINSSGIETEILAPYLFEYNLLGQLVLQGLELDGVAEDLYDKSNNDRITGSSSEFWKDTSGYWWQINRSYAYPVAGSSATAVLAQETRTRLFADLGELSETVVEDTNGHEITTVVTIDRTKGIAAAETSHEAHGGSSAINPSTVVQKLGLPVYRKEPSGVDVEYDYDGLRRLKSVKTRDNVHVFYKYINGSRKRYQYGEGIGGSTTNILYHTTYAYDTHGRLDSVKKANYAATALPDELTYFDYDKRGKVIRTWGDGSYPIAYDYDSYGRLDKQRQYRDSTNATGINDDKYSEVEWNYQANTGLLASKTHYDQAAGKSVSYQYNDLGAVSKRTWNRGVYTDYTYSVGNDTSTGQLTYEDHSDTTSDILYTHDRMGRLKTVDDYSVKNGWETGGLPVNPLTFTYGASNGLAISKLDLDKNFYGTANDFHYLYETAVSGEIPGRYKGFGLSPDPSDDVWSQSYEAGSGRVDAITASHTLYSESFDYSYDGDSNHVLSMAGSDYQQTRSWESWRENYAQTKTSWNGSTRADYAAPKLTWQYQLHEYTLDYVDSSLNLAKKLGASADIVYTMTYDERGQVKSWDSDRTSGTTDSSYVWDSAGNPTDYAGQVYTVNGLNELEPNGAAYYTYDGDGNLTHDTKQGWTYSYDANNRIASMYSSSKHMKFYYDYLGRRVEKQIWDSGSASGDPDRVLRFLYHGMELIAEMDDAGNVLKSFHWGIDKSDTRGGAGGAMGLLMMKIHPAEPGEPVEPYAGEYYPAYDMNGNVTGMLDNSGNWAAWYEYDAFGKVIKEGGVTVGSTNFMDVNPIRFSTQYTDDESGLVYYGFRYYDSSQGRFLTRDPIGEQGGANLYRFVGNDPIHNVDVWGLCIQPEAEGRIETQEDIDFFADQYRAYLDCLFNTAKEAGGDTHSSQVAALGGGRDFLNKTFGEGFGLNADLGELEVLGLESLARSNYDKFGNSLNSGEHRNFHTLTFYADDPNAAADKVFEALTDFRFFNDGSVATISLNAEGTIARFVPNALWKEFAMAEFGFHRGSPVGLQIDQDNRSITATTLEGHFHKHPIGALRSTQSINAQG